MSKRASRHIKVTGNGNVIGNQSQSHVVKTEIKGPVTGSTVVTAGGDVTYGVSSDALTAIFADFVRELRARPDIAEEDKEDIASQVRELETTLKSPQPDLGTVQRVKKFLIKKGGWVATAAGALFSNPSVVKVIEEAAKKLLGN